MDTRTQPEQPESKRTIIGWKCTTDGKHFAEFKEKRCRYCVPIYELVCPVCGIVDQEPFGADGHRLGAGCPETGREL